MRKLFAAAAIAVFVATVSAQDSDGPWLPKLAQQKVKDMWPDGVPFPPTLKFYSLRPASQRVAAFGAPGAGNNRRFVPATFGNENANREFPWIGSGGMDYAERGTWRNVTGMALPENAKIKVWLATMPVSNGFGSTQNEWAMHWAFPSGTAMFDVLIRRNDDGSEHIFNVRRRIKEAKRWDDGASFLPDVETGKVWTYSSPGTRRSRNVLGVERITYRVAESKPLDPKRRYKFKESLVAIDDGGHFFPPGFKGTGVSCNKCHNGGAHEAQVYGGPLLRGKDTVMSWYPVFDSLVVDGESLESSLFSMVHVPGVDGRWPLDN